VKPSAASVLPPHAPAPPNLEYQAGPPDAVTADRDPLLSCTNPHAFGGRQRDCGLHDVCDVDSSALDAATAQHRTVVDMNRPWDRVFPFDHVTR